MRAQAAWGSMIVFCMLALPGGVLAQSGRGKTIVVKLQNAPHSMEPEREPKAIRVDNRGRVTIRVENLSPLDVCSLGSRVTTPATETSPIAALITTISGLGGISFDMTNAKLSINSTAQAAKKETYAVNLYTGKLLAGEIATGQEPVLEDYRYKEIYGKNGFQQKFHEDAQAANSRQSELLRNIQGCSAETATCGPNGPAEGDIQKLADYVDGDYRGTNWKNFDPHRDLGPTVGKDANSPMPSLSAAQAQYDLLAVLVAQLHHDYPKLDEHANPQSIQAMNHLDLLLSGDHSTLGELGAANTALEGVQKKLRKAYEVAINAYVAFQRNSASRAIRTGEDNPAVLVEDFPLAPDRKTTVTGVVSCVSALDMTTATTDAIDYSVLYQNVPILTASAGLTVSFIRKQIVGTTETNTGTPSAPAFNTTFAITDSAPAQAIPMAFLNARFLPYYQFHFPGRETEHIFTVNASGGFGVNPNSGSNQPEFFTGLAFGFGRVLIHTGMEIGRTQHLGGGFGLTDPVPPNFPGSVPLTWTYDKGFAFGLSVRVAPF